MEDPEQERPKFSFSDFVFTSFSARRMLQRNMIVFYTAISKAMWPTTMRSRLSIMKISALNLFRQCILHIWDESKAGLTAILKQNWNPPSHLPSLVLFLSAFLSQ